MFFKSVLLFVVLLVVNVMATPFYPRPSALYDDSRIIRQEAACAVQGGMCQAIDDCNPSDIVRVAELCPLQSHLGVVCCYYQ